MCMADSADRCDFYTESNLKARKKHICGECRREINKGEQYQYVFGVWEGKPSYHKTCQHCVSAQAWLRNECGSWLFGGILEDLEDHLYGESMTPYRLVIGMRRQWIKFNSNELMNVIGVNNG